MYLDLKTGWIWVVEVVQPMGWKGAWCLGPHLVAWDLMEVEEGHIQVLGDEVGENCALVPVDGLVDLEVVVVGSLGNLDFVV